MGLFTKAIAQSDSILLPQTFQEELDSLIAQNKVPGIIAAVIDGETIMDLAHAGIREFGKKELIEKDDLFHIGSCTKAMTSYMLAQIVEEGKLSWESSFEDVFPEWKDSVHITYHSKTLHDFITHTAGVPANARNWSAYPEDSMINRRSKLVLANLKKQATDGHLYSNLGYMIAGHMAEKVTGKSWEDLMKERLFEPLNMTSAGFGPPGIQDTLLQPKGHTKSLFGKKWNSYYLDNDPALGPAGTVHCSIQDWTKFIQAQFFEDENVADNFLLQPKLENYASGWAVVERPWAKGTAYTHSGSNTVWLAVAWVAPNIDRAYLIMTNSFGQQTGVILDELVGRMINKYSDN